MVKYGLRVKKTGELLKVITSSNEGSDCTDISHTLVSGYGPDWLVDDPINAEYVRLNSTEWYNATYDTPSHGFEADELEVVKVEVTININPVEVKIPTVEEYLKIMYEKKDPGHYKYLLSELKKGWDVDYTIYDLIELIRKGLWKP